jgi:hypothetical protein
MSTNEKLLNVSNESEQQQSNELIKTNEETKMQQNDEQSKNSKEENREKQDENKEKENSNKQQSKGKKIFEIYSTSSEFHCGGKCVSGPDRSTFYGTIGLILIPEGAFIGLM